MLLCSRSFTQVSKQGTTGSNVVKTKIRFLYWRWSGWGPSWTVLKWLKQLPVVVKYTADWHILAMFIHLRVIWPVWTFNAKDYETMIFKYVERACQKSLFLCWLHESFSKTEWIPTDVLGAVAQEAEWLIYQSKGRWSIPGYCTLDVEAFSINWTQMHPLECECVNKC